MGAHALSHRSLPGDEFNWRLQAVTQIFLSNLVFGYESGATSLLPYIYDPKYRQHEA